MLHRNFMRFSAGAIAGLILLGGMVPLLAFWAEEYKSGIIWPEPAIVDPGPAAEQPAAAPSDAIVLFDGTDLSAFKGGESCEIKDGAATMGKGGLTTKQAFGDCQLHLEFATPAEVKGSGQGRGNSGVYLMGKYEIQILDSYENETYFDGQCGAVYKQQPPIVNASRGPGQWQTYDILFEAPRFDAKGNVLKKAVVTVLHNGVLIHNHLQLEGSTSYTEPAKYSKHPAKLPFNIQYHGNPVRLRNIWVREAVHPLVGLKPAPAGAQPVDDKVEVKKPKKQQDGAKPQANKGPANKGGEEN
ncbi:MAG: DUF1080 domain-containing protein [Pirellulaceae bacterium]